MPVPALPPDNTVRWYLDYNNGYDNHILMARSTTTVDNAAASTFFDGFLTALGAHLAEISIIGLSVAFEGSNVRIPQEWLNDPSYGSGTMPAIDRPAQMTFVGKDGLGHKTRVGMFGLNGVSSDTWRIHSADSASVTAAIAALGTDPGFFLTVSGGVPIWKNYANVGINDHWVKKARSA
jgi:hypothetical protein